MRVRRLDQVVTPSDDRSLAFFRALIGSLRPRDFKITTWTGAVWEPESGQPARFTLRINHPRALATIFYQRTEVALAEAYIFNDLEVTGDIRALLRLAEYLLSRPTDTWTRLRQIVALLRLQAAPRPATGPAARLSGVPHSQRRDAAAISYHYDTSNDFFALFLDPRMVYSCAYFPSPEASLAQAQETKLDLICRKLKLAAGQTLLDVGCGWGGLLIFAAERYGVKGFGITLSQAQADYANSAIRDRGLATQCKVSVMDYRDLGPDAVFDKVVSVGMAEHVGVRMLQAYFGSVWKAVRPGGLFLHHAIAYTRPTPSRRGPTFFSRYVFPDGELVPISDSLRAAELSGFEVRGVESLREHYIRTLDHWLEQLESRSHEAIAMVGEARYRVWRLYFAAARRQFEAVRTTIYQTVLERPQDGEAGAA